MSVKVVNERGFFKRSLSPKLGIFMLFLGTLLLFSPFFSDIYTKHQQALLLEEYRKAFANKPDLDFLIFNEDDEDSVFILPDGAPTGFENVILIIPSLDVEVAVIGPPKDFAGYGPMLLKAPVFFRDSVYPGGQGNVAITAHRLDHGSYFYDLDLLEEGDKIYLETPGLRFEYIVQESKIIDETDTSIVRDHADPHYLVLVTCEPKDTRQPTPIRLAVRAELETTEPLD